VARRRFFSSLRELVDHAGESRGDVPLTRLAHHPEALESDVLVRPKVELPRFLGMNLWRTVFRQQEVAKLAKTAIDYPPLQEAASFNLDAVRKRSKRRQATGSKRPTPSKTR
jgi:hypothetical protein